MITVRKAQDRGHFDFGWLKTFHTFSFGDYHDPDHKGFRTLRVINEDFVSADQGFGTHPHRDMEILTYVLSGALAHKDSMGTGSTILPGDVQRMSAGTGVTHSEFNHSKTETTHLYQIWIFPEAKDLKPEYEQKSFKEKDKANRLCLIASRDGREGSITIHQDVSIYASVLEGTLNSSLGRGRGAWLQLVSGSLKCNDVSLSPSDGASVVDEKDLKIEGKSAHFLLFDLR